MNTLAINISHLNSSYLDDRALEKVDAKYLSTSKTISKPTNISSHIPNGSMVPNFPTFLKKNIKKPLPTNNLYSLELIQFQTPISLVSYLIREIEKSLIAKFKLIWRNKERVAKVTLHFYHKKTKRLHMIEIKPDSPSIELDDFIDVLEEQLKHTTLDIPINSVEIELQRY